MVKVLECVGAHYKVQDVQRARVYKWCPAIVTVECECGERLTLTSSTSTCLKCWADHTDVFADILGIGMEDEGEQPWHFLRSYFSHPTSI